MENDGFLYENAMGRRRSAGICPLLSLKGESFNHEDCMETSCAWWVEEKQCCAIQLIARETFLLRTGGQQS